jgi:hypothetical protein
VLRIVERSRAQRSEDAGRIDDHRCATVLERRGSRPVGS